MVRLLRQLGTRELQVFVTQLDADHLGARTGARDGEGGNAGAAREIEDASRMDGDLADDAPLPPAIDAKRRPMHHGIVAPPRAFEEALDQGDAAIVAACGR